MLSVPVQLIASKSCPEISYYVLRGMLSTCSLVHPVARTMINRSTYKDQQQQNFYQRSAAHSLTGCNLQHVVSRILTAKYRIYCAAKYFVYIVTAIWERVHWCTFCC